MKKLLISLIKPRIVGLFCLLLVLIAAAVFFIQLQQKVVIVVSDDMPQKQNTVHATSTHSYIPQFVLLSFDGSKSVDIWRQTRAFEDEMEAQNKPLNFTYFVNAAYFFTADKKNIYQAPRMPLGLTNIGYSEDRTNIGLRIAEVNKAVADGDEIASHTVGHFSGGSWTSDEWKQEFSSFSDILFGVEKNYPEEQFPKLTTKTSDVVGFRAPSLSIGSGLYQALHDTNVLYDSSETGNGKTWPTKDASGLWHIPLGRVYLNNGTVPSIAMDYNIWAYQTKNKDVYIKGTPEWTAAYDDVLAAYLRYFNTNYAGNRAPVLIGHHFEDWNDGLYWEAMKTFASDVCGKPEVRCGTFKELVTYLNEYGVPNIQATSTHLVK